MRAAALSSAGLTRRWVFFKKLRLKVILMPKELEKKYIQLQMLKQQLSAFVEEKNLLNEKVSELVVTIDALNKLGNIKQGDEMWSSLGSSAFVRSDIKDIEKVLIGIGAGIVVKEEKGKAAEILHGRLSELSKLDSEMMAEINKLGSMIAELEPEVQKLAEEESKK